MDDSVVDRPSVYGFSVAVDNSIFNALQTVGKEKFPGDICMIRQGISGNSFLFVDSLA